MNVEHGRRGSEPRLDEVSLHVHPGEVRPAVKNPCPGSATMFDTRLPRSLRMLMTLIRHGRRFGAIAAIAAVMPFGAAPVFAQAVADALPGPAAGRSGPLNVVASSVSRVLTIIRSQPADATEKRTRRAAIREAAVELFDFDEMSRQLLGQRWTDASPEEQRDFVVLFTDLLERAYLNTIVNYRLATITFQTETISGSYAQVQSKMVADKGEVAIEFRLLEQDGRWAVYDVAVDGVSLISNYRSQFNSILKRMSFAQLLDRLRNREASEGSPRDGGQR